MTHFKKRGDVFRIGNLFPQFLEGRKHFEILVCGKLQGPITISLDTNREVYFLDFIRYFDILFMLLRPVQILTYVYGFKIVHKLINELGNSYLG